MKSLFIGLMASVLTLSSINIAMASNTPMHVSIEDISTLNMYSINEDVITDGRMFEEMSYRKFSGDSSPYNLLQNTIWWAGSEGMVTMDFGKQFIIQDVLIQVDAYDSYKIDYSIDNINWSNLFTISPEDGESLYGMDTMSSDILHEEYVASIDFSIVETRYLRVSASDGDGTYFLSELQAFGTPSSNTIEIQSNQTISPVPAPPSVMLFGAGLMMLMGLQYRRKKMSL